MPKQIVVNAWCDPCFKEGNNTPAEEVTVSLGDFKNAKPHTLLMCETHRKEYYDALFALLEEFGELAGSSRRSSTSVPKDEGGTLGAAQTWICPLCHERRPSRDALGKHARSGHGITITTLLSEPVEFVCKSCPAKPAQEYGTGTGFAAHRRAQHELSPDDPLLPGENLLDDREYLKTPKAKGRAA